MALMSSGSKQLQIWQVEVVHKKKNKKKKLRKTNGDSDVAMDCWSLSANK